MNSLTSLLLAMVPYNLGHIRQRDFLGPQSKKRLSTMHNTCLVTLLSERPPSSSSIFQKQKGASDCDHKPRLSSSCWQCQKNLFQICLRL